MIGQLIKLPHFLLTLIDNSADSCWPPLFFTWHWVYITNSNFCSRDLCTHHHKWPQFPHWWCTSRWEVFALVPLSTEWYNYTARQRPFSTEQPVILIRSTSWHNLTLHMAGSLSCPLSLSFSLQASCYWSLVWRKREWGDGAQRSDATALNTAKFKDEETDALWCVGSQRIGSDGWKGEWGDTDKCICLVKLGNVAKPCN